MDSRHIKKSSVKNTHSIYSENCFFGFLAWSHDKHCQRLRLNAKERRQNLPFKILLFSGIFQRTVLPLSEALRFKKRKRSGGQKTLRCSGLILFKQLIYGGQMRFLSRISKGWYQCHYRKSGGCRRRSSRTGPSEGSAFESALPQRF